MEDGTMTTKTKEAGVDRALRIHAAIRAAENTRCACGYHGSWDDDDVVHGTTGYQVPTVWAGCPNCTGSAVGVPITPDELAWYRRHADEYRHQFLAADVIDFARKNHPQPGCEFGIPQKEYGRDWWRVPLSDQYGEVAHVAVLVEDGEPVESRVVCHV
jgi:hypothetical protein